MVARSLEPEGRPTTPGGGAAPGRPPLGTCRRSGAQIRPASASRMIGSRAARDADPGRTPPLLMPMAVAAIGAPSAEGEAGRLGVADRPPAGVSAEADEVGDEAWAFGWGWDRRRGLRRKSGRRWTGLVGAAGGAGGCLRFRHRRPAVSAEPQAVELADHGVAADPAQAVGDLGRAQPVDPMGGERAYAVLRPGGGLGHEVILPARSARAHQSGSFLRLRRRRPRSGPAS